MLQKQRNVLFLLLFLLSPCLGMSQTYIPIKLEVDAPATQVAHNKKIVTLVEDARAEDDVIGRSSEGKNIVLSSDLLSNIQIQIDKNLSNSGFQLVKNNEKEPTKLVVRIIGIQYRQMNDPWSNLVLESRLVATAVIEVMATSNRKIYKKTYRTDNEYSSVFPHIQADISQINSTISTVPPSFQFSQEEPESSLIAFSLACVGTDSHIDVNFINVNTDQANHFGFNCDREKAYNQIEILKMSAGYYTFGKVSYSVGSETHYTNEKNRFYFTLQPHKVNYIGRIEYSINKDEIFTSVDDASSSDIHQIKLALPEISSKDYVALFWERDDLGDFRAK
jgi:uncharacterized lipoprotein YajG